MLRVYELAHSEMNEHLLVPGAFPRESRIGKPRDQEHRPAQESQAQRLAAA
jgi:hypothetical protein